MAYTTQPATGEAPTQGHNSSPSLDQCAALIRDYWTRAKSDNRATLENFRLIGETLNEAKEALKGTSKGAFGTWCDEQGFTFDKSWRARMMKLADNWTAVMDAVQAVPDGDKRLWSLDGVLALYRASQKPTGGDAGADDSDGGGEGDGASTGPKETKAQRLERMLQEALERIAALEAENAKLKGGPKQKAQEGKGDASEASGKVNAATKARASKVWGLYTRGAPEGEQASAKQRLMEMAEKAGFSFADFVAACGLRAAA